VALLTPKTQSPPKRRFTLAWEIGIVLIVKCVLLWLLWYFFFSTPQVKHMQMPEPQVTQHVLSESFTPVSSHHD
jgi:hypothetical protein